MASPASHVTRRAGDCSAAVAIVASAGGISALIELLGRLPPSFPLPIVVSQHLPPTGTSMLPAILGWRAQLPVKWAEPGELPCGGVVYLVPPGSTLGFSSDGFAITPTNWLCCPDVLLGSLAREYGSGAIGIVLSGALAVGISGLRAIRRGGGVTMAQNEASASHFAMPCGAIDLGKVEVVLSPSKIAAALIIISEVWMPNEVGGPKTCPPPVSCICASPLRNE